VGGSNEAVPLNFIESRFTFNKVRAGGAGLRVLMRDPTSTNSTFSRQVDYFRVVRHPTTIGDWITPNLR
jgi:hypothetical protein